MGVSKKLWSSTFQYRFCIDRDFHHIANDDTALFQRGAPADPKVMAVDFGSGNKAGAGFRPLVLAVLPQGVSHVPRKLTFKVASCETPRIVKSPLTA